MTMGNLLSVHKCPRVCETTTYTQNTSTSTG